MQKAQNAILLEERHNVSKKICTEPKIRIMCESENKFLLKCINKNQLIN